MSGHSRWAQIKRQKGTADAKRGTLYTKLSNMISGAVREGGKDPAMNVRLRLLLEKARSANMPSATVERAVKRGAGELPGGMIERVLYEAFGPGGVACIIEAVTDNKNRTTADIRRVLTKHGGNLGTSGSVQWKFEIRGTVEIPTATLTPDQELTLIDAGADDLLALSDAWLVSTRPDRLEAIRGAIEHLGLPAKNLEIVFVPKNETLTQLEDDRALVAFLDDLEALDDVTNVTTNAG